MEARVTAGVTVLVGLALGAVLFATLRAVGNQSLTRATQDLEVARSTFTRSLESRAESAAALTRLITELPVFRAHLTDSRLVSDASSIGAMADRYRRQLNAQFCIVTDSHGTWIGKPGWTAPTPPPGPLQSMIDAAIAGRSRRGIVTVQNQLFLLISEPVRFADEVLGTLSVAYALDDTVAKQLAEATHCEVNLVTGSHINGSSLGADQRMELERWLFSQEALSKRIPASTGRWRLGGEEYVAGVFSLAADQVQDRANRLVLLQAWGPTQHFLATLQTQFLAAGAHHLSVRRPRRIRLQQKRHSAPPRGGCRGARHRDGKLGAAGAASRKCGSDDGGGGIQ